MGIRNSLFSSQYRYAKVGYEYYMTMCVEWQRKLSDGASPPPLPYAAPRSWENIIVT